MNATWQRLIDSYNYKATDTQIYNIPNLMCNLVASYKITPELSVYTNINYLSSQKTTFESPDEIGMPIYTEISIPSRAIVNLGATYQIQKLRLGIRTYNTFNKHYEQGGTSIGPIQQQGFWVLGEIAYKL
jgi:iron complex outermembrane receptor protein